MRDILLDICQILSQMPLLDTKSRHIEISGKN